MHHVIFKKYSLSAEDTDGRTKAVVEAATFDEGRGKFIYLSYIQESQRVAWIIEVRVTLLPSVEELNVGDASVS